MVTHATTAIVKGHKGCLATPSPRKLVFRVVSIEPRHFNSNSENHDFTFESHKTMRFFEICCNVH
jgi:hypothetical protein